MKKFLNSKVTDMTWGGYLGFIAVIYGGMYLYIHSGDLKDWIGKKIKKNWGILWPKKIESWRNLRLFLFRENYILLYENIYI